MSVYINKKSNHPTKIKEIPKAIAKWMSDISSSEVVFNESIPIYLDTLRKKGFHDNTTFIPKPLSPRQTRKRHVSVKSYGSILHIVLVPKQMLKGYS